MNSDKITKEFLDINLINNMSPSTTKFKFWDKIIDFEIFLDEISEFRKVGPIEI